MHACAVKHAVATRNYSRPREMPIVCSGFYIKINIDSLLFEAINRTLIRISSDIRECYSLRISASWREYWIYTIHTRQLIAKWVKKYWRQLLLPNYFAGLAHHDAARLLLPQKSKMRSAPLPSAIMVELLNFFISFLEQGTHTPTAESIIRFWLLVFIAQSINTYEMVIKFFCWATPPRACVCVS